MPRPSPWPIDLAHVRPFRIGNVEVRPASREVVSGNHREVLEPLVMQVLVALASARGEILSRDDLIDACWGGRAVTDDAINRVLSRLRALARTFESFQVETITKVGYRLIDQSGDQFPEVPPLSVEESPRSGLNRRTLVAGGAVVATLGAGAVLWRKPWRHRPPPEAAEFYRLAEIAHRQGVSSQSRQAITYYEQAVRADPLYSQAWGGLALSNTHLLEGYGETQIAGVPDRIRSAARRALELDPDNPDAQVALIHMNPSFGNWTRMEADLRRLRERHPTHWLLQGRLAVLLYDVGRLEDGIEIHKQLFEMEPMLATGHAYLAGALLNAGRLQETEELLDWAHDRWPAHAGLWEARYTYLIYSGRPGSAAAFVMDPESRPSGYGPAEVDPLLRLTRALDTKRPADVSTSIEDFRQMALADRGSMPFCATVFALLGQLDLTFECLERYFFNRGSFGPSMPIGPYTRRYARALFTPPLAPLRSDPRLLSLLSRAGLDDYWRKTGTLPDYRHTK